MMDDFQDRVRNAELEVIRLIEEQYPDAPELWDDNVGDLDEDLRDLQVDEAYRVGLRDGYILSLRGLCDRAFKRRSQRYVMKPTDQKAVALVVDRQVKVISATFNNDDDLVAASGLVKEYHTTITPDGVACSCEFGTHSNKSHSHDRALRLAAITNQQKDTP